MKKNNDIIQKTYRWSYRLVKKSQSFLRKIQKNNQVMTKKAPKKQGTPFDFGAFLTKTSDFNKIL